MTLSGYRGLLSLSGSLLLLGFAGSPAQAGTIMQTVNLSPSGSDSNVTNGHLITAFDVSPSFNQFNPAVGTLVSATLGWDAAGSMNVNGNFKGQGIMSYETSSDTEGWNIYGGSTTVNFSLSGTELLNLATVTGTGTFSQGDFKETFQLQEGYFPASFTTASTSGNFTLTYAYSSPTDDSTPTDTPEPASIMYVSPGIALLALGFRRRLNQQR
jgi:hypothetical protein